MAPEPLHRTYRRTRKADSGRLSPGRNAQSERDPRQYIKGIEAAIEAVEEGRLDPFPLFSHSFPLEEADRAFQHLTQRPDGFIKALIINDTES